MLMDDIIQNDHYHNMNSWFQRSKKAIKTLSAPSLNAPNTIISGVKWVCDGHMILQIDLYDGWLSHVWVKFYVYGKIRSWSWMIWSIIYQQHRMIFNVNDSFTSKCYVLFMFLNLSLFHFTKHWRPYWNMWHRAEFENRGTWHFLIW